MIISSLFLITLSNKNKKHFILCSQNLSIPYTYFINIEQETSSCEIFKKVYININI